MSAQGKQFKVNVSTPLGDAKTQTVQYPGTMYIPEGSHTIVFNGTIFHTLTEEEIAALQFLLEEDTTNLGLPKFDGVVESAVISDSTGTDTFTGIFYIKSEKQFAAGNGTAFPGTGTIITNSYHSTWGSPEGYYSIDYYKTPTNKLFVCEDKVYLVTSSGITEIGTSTGGGSGEDYSDEIAALQSKMDILYKVALAFTSGSKNYKKGSVQTPSISWTVKVNGTSVNPSSQHVVFYNGTTKEVDKDLDLSTRTYTLPSSISTNSRVIITADGVSITADFSFYNPAYYGIVSSDFAITEPNNIKSLTELTNYGNKGYSPATITGTSGVNKICYAYPKVLGALSSIKDGFGNTVTGSFTLSEVNINNESYYVYLLTDAANLNGIKVTFA